jgi:hypothetical protein
MFEFQHLLGSTEHRIQVQTQRGNDVPNVLGLALTEQHRQRYQKLLDDHGAAWRERKPPNGSYNCAGHVWASRRTNIYEESAWRLILSDDGYRRTSQPLPDDLALYVDSRLGLLHVARIVELRPGLTPQSTSIPLVISKWNDFGGETIHLARDVPFLSLGFDLSIEYWTDRPSEKGK